VTRTSHPNGAVLEEVRPKRTQTKAKNRKPQRKKSQKQKEKGTKKKNPSKQDGLIKLHGARRLLQAVDSKFRWPKLRFSDEKPKTKRDASLISYGRVPCLSAEDGGATAETRGGSC